jgi:hypothetical protein
MQLRMGAPDAYQILFITVTRLWWIILKCIVESGVATPDILRLLLLAAVVTLRVKWWQIIIRPPTRDRLRHGAETLRLGAFERSRKPRQVYVCPSVHPPGTTRLPLDGSSWNLIFIFLNKICTANLKFGQPRTKKEQANYMTSYARFYHLLLSLARIPSTGIYTNQSHFCVGSKWRTITENKNVHKYYLIFT